MVWVPGKTKFSYARARGAVDVSQAPVGGVSNVADLDSDSNTVLEGAATGTTVGITANATDPTPGDTVTYSLLDSAGSPVGRFKIDSGTGVVTVDDGTQLVFAADQSHDITVRATSTDGSTADATFTISVLELEAGSPDAGSPSGPSGNPTADWIGFWSNGATAAAADEADANLMNGKQIKYQHFKLATEVEGIDQPLNDNHKNAMQQFTDDLPHVTLTSIFDLYPTNKATGPEFAAIAAGTHDVKLQALADRLIETGHDDMIIRLYHEMDIETSGVTFRGAAQADGIAAWRHIHALFNARAGANFVWQYSMNGPGGNTSPIFDGGVPVIDYCYPGDAFVDTLSFSTYDRGGFSGDSAATIEKLNYGVDFAIAHNLGFGSAEWGLWPTANGGGGDRPQFIQDMHDWAVNRPSTGPGFLGTGAYFLYFDHLANVTLDQYPNAKATWKTLFGNP